MCVSKYIEERILSMKKVLAGLLLAMSLIPYPSYAAGSNLTAGAEVSTQNGELHSVPVSIEMESPLFSVTLPTSLPVSISEMGEISVSDEAAITNDSGSSVSIHDIIVTVAEGWTLMDYDTHNTDKVGKKEFSLCINDMKSTSNSFIWEDFTLSTESEGDNKLPLVYDVKMPLQLSPFNGSIANIVCIVGWDI